MPLECGIIFDGIPEGAIPRKVGLIWGIPVKTGGRLVLHARRLVFQLAEVLVTREMLTGILERISRLRLAPG